MPLHNSNEGKQQFQLSEKCWPCEKSLEAKVADLDHLTGKYPGAACNKCNLNCSQVKSSLFQCISTFLVNMTVI